MPSFTHQKLLTRIADIDKEPNEPSGIKKWLAAESHLQFVRENSRADELVVYAASKGFFMHALVVPNQLLKGHTVDGLLAWNDNPYSTIASYVWGGEQPGLHIERSRSGRGSEILDKSWQLIFMRTFRGWEGVRRTYCEVLQEYSHLTDIHWRDEHKAYCRYDENGDLECSVSESVDEGAKVKLVSFQRKALEPYLAIADATLVQLFDFTLSVGNAYPRWEDEPEERIVESDHLAYRRRSAGASAAYTRGFNIVQLSRPRSEIEKQWFEGGDRQYVEFLAHDFRNNRVTKISTDPVATTNYFEAQTNSLPFELSPAFFRPEVLTKYKNDRAKYEVGERDITCRDTWTLRAYDVNEAKQVHAYICYLRNLPHSEQLYWASFNEEPKAPISKRALTADFKGEFTEVISPSQKMISCLTRWNEKNVYWWKLRDIKLIRNVNIPFGDSREVWADAFLDLAKLIVEGFVKAEIVNKLTEKGVTFAKDEGSIRLLERLIDAETGHGNGTRLEGIRTIQFIRTIGKGHFGGSEAVKLSAEAIQRYGSYADHFIEICKVAADDLVAIERALIAEV